jgi:hypothetical protein
MLGGFHDFFEACRTSLSAPDKSREDETSGSRKEQRNHSEKDRP